MKKKSSSQSRLHYSSSSSLCSHVRELHWKKPNHSGARPPLRTATREKPEEEEEAKLLHFRGACVLLLCIVSLLLQERTALPKSEKLSGVRGNTKKKKHDDDKNNCRSLEEDTTLR
jgi:hypothetical protein